MDYLVELRVERQEGNYEFGESKVNIYGSKDTYEHSNSKIKHRINTRIKYKNAEKTMH